MTRWTRKGDGEADGAVVIYPITEVAECALPSSFAVSRWEGETRRMRVILLVALHGLLTLAQSPCSQHDQTLNCKTIEWTDLPSAETYSNLSQVERLALSQVSGTQSWNTSAFSAVNFVSIESGVLMMEPFQDLVKLPHLSILHVKNTPVQCWTDDKAEFLKDSVLESLLMVSSLNCDDALKFSLSETMHELDLSENWLNIFPHVEGRMLTYLRLSDNNLHDVGNLSLLPNLFELDLSRNPLGKIPIEAFSHNPELVRLNLSSSSLETANFQGPFLETLTLSSNYLVNLKRSFFAGMPYLTILDLTRNEITELSDQFHDLTKLRQLHLSHNYLREVKAETLSQLQALEILKLDSNRLTSLPDLENNLPCLHLLDISNNSIAILDAKFFSRVPYLATLYASFNGLRNMDDAMIVMHGLKKLIAEGNNLQVDSRTFASMEQLNTLDLSSNSLTISLDVFANNLALKDLNVMHNAISDICGEQHLPLQLGSVNIAYNQVSNLDCLEGLYSLNITGNPIICGDNLKSSLKEALYTEFDSDERDSDAERVVQDSDKEEWVEVYKSVCDEDPLLVGNRTKLTSELPGDSDEDSANENEDENDDDDDDDDDDASDDYHDMETEMELIQSQRFDEESFWRFRGHAGTKSVLIWAALGFAVFGFMLLSLVATVYMIVWVQNRRKRTLRSQHVSSYEQLRSPVYSETTSRVPGSNFSANLGRVLTDNPIAGAFKSESMVGVFGKLGFKSGGPDDELEVKMIPSESTTSLA